MKYKHIGSLVIICAALAFCGGCVSTLQPGGAYAPVGQVSDKQFYVADAAYDLAYAALDGAFKFERANRAALWQTSPSIKRTLDQIRPQAVDWNKKYHAARAVYMANPVPDNLTELQTVLAKIQQLATAATAVLPKGK